MLQVKDLMSDTLDVVSPDTHLHEALTKMNLTGYRHLPVVADDMLIGIITDRDVRLAVNSPFVGADADLTRESVLDGVRVDVLKGDSAQRGQRIEGAFE